MFYLNIYTHAPLEAFLKIKIHSLQCLIMMQMNGKMQNIMLSLHGNARLHWHSGTKKPQSLSVETNLGIREKQMNISRPRDKRPEGCG